MSLPTQESLISAFPGDVWSQAAILESCVESKLSKIIPVGGRVACAPYEATRTDGGMILTEAVGKTGAHVDIAAETGAFDMNIYGMAVPGAHMNEKQRTKMTESVASFTLSGEVVCAKLRKFAEHLDTSDPSTFVVETVAA